MTKLLEAALEYASKGWPIFPCRVDKTPYTDRGVLDATTNPAQLKEWWGKWPNANPAVDVAGAGMVVLDFDPGRDPAEVEERLGEWPSTKLVSQTPRGGEHEFFAIKDGEIIPPSASKIAKNVDVRSFHSYVLLPPSRTKDGTYTWVSQGKPAFRPQKLVELATAHREQSEEHDHWIIDADLEENVALCAEWLRVKAKPAIVGQGGDSTTYATAAMCKSFGISPEMALDLMWEHWCPRCSPPWDESGLENLEVKIRNGYRYNTSPPGNMTPAYKVAKAQAIFKPVSRDTKDGGREIKGGRFRIVDRKGMNSIEPPKWLIKDAITEGGFALLIGPRGTFKTFIAMDMALSIATGARQYFGPDEEWYGVWPDVAEPGPVLFAAGEGRAGLLQRLRAWEDKHLDGNEAENFYLIDPVPRPTPEDVTAFIEYAQQFHKTYRLVVLDTVGRSMQGLNENSQQDASMFTQLAETIQRELGAAVMGLHHTGHGAEDRARGSSVFGADVDTEFVLQRKEKEFFVYLNNTKQKDGVEWDKAKVIQLAKHKDSLVAVAPSKQIQAQAEVSRDTKAKRKEEAKIDLKIIRDAAMRVLANSPGTAFSKNKLADAIAAQEQVQVGASSVKKMLEHLLTDKAHPVSRCYDAIKGTYSCAASDKEAKALFTSRRRDTASASS